MKQSYMRYDTFIITYSTVNEKREQNMFHNLHVGTKFLNSNRKTSLWSLHTYMYTCALCARTHTKILHMNAHMHISHLWASAPFQMLTAYHNGAPNTPIRAPCFHRLFGKLDSSRPTTVLTTKNAFGKSKRCIAPLAAWHAQQLLLLLRGSKGVVIMHINPVHGSTNIYVLHQGTGSTQPAF